MTFTIVWHRGQTFLSGASPGVTVAAPTGGRIVGATGGLGGGPAGGADFLRARRNPKSRKRTRTMATAMSGVFHKTAVSPTASVRSGIAWVPTGIAKRRVAATVRKDANTRPRPVIPTPPQGDRSAPQGSRYLMFPRLNRTPESPGKSLMNPDVRRPAGSHMPEIVESVPNFSEGRRKEVVDAIAQAIASVPGVRVLDQEMDADHNRSVITFVGDRTSLAEAAFRGATKTVELIDMNRHRG